MLLVSCHRKLCLKQGQIVLEDRGICQKCFSTSFYDISTVAGCQGQAGVSVVVNNNRCQDISSHAGAVPWMPAIELLHSWQVCWCCDISMRRRFGFPYISRFRAEEVRSQENNPGCGFLLETLMTSDMWGGNPNPRYILSSFFLTSVSGLVSRYE